MTLTQILAQSEETFLVYGIKSITMDDLARKMGISKKTLYQFVRDKKDLVRKVMKYHLENEKKAILQIIRQNDNAIDELFALGQRTLPYLSRINPSVLYDLQKYYPDCWKMFLDFKNTFIYSLVLENLKKGIAQGLYRDDFKPDIVARFYSARTEIVVSQEIFPPPKYALAEVYAEYLKYHLRAISSANGLKYMSKLKLF
ncbi:MAG: TetR family transcriptional regulator [Chitinophagales bacterium]|nr:MAG: TetR family transcriptional regulator [Chitinophagales bacterium]